MQEEECEEADGGTSVADRDPENPDLADLADPALCPTGLSVGCCGTGAALSGFFSVGGCWVCRPSKRRRQGPNGSLLLGGAHNTTAMFLRSFGNVWLRQNRQGRPGVAFGGPKPTMYCTTFLAGLCW